MGRQSFIKRRGNLKVILISLLLLVLCSVVIAPCLGPVKVPVGETFKIIFSKVPIVGQLIDSDWTLVQENIILQLRLPRVFLGLIVGASLAIAGVAMQALVRNQLADPFILGVSAGASMFATLGMIFGVFSFLGSYSLSLSAFLGAIVSILLVYLISRVRGKIVITQLLLSGVVISMVFEGFTKIITLSAPNALGLHNAEFWMSGSLAGAKWSYLTLPLVVMLLCGFYLLLHYRTLNALLFGEDSAATMGVNVKNMQKSLILVTSLLAGVTISVSGSIGFIGLICPHFARLLVGGDHRKVLPIAALSGGILVVWTDVLARMVIAPQELPIGILTAIIGGPIFIIILKRNRDH